jgi:hypothetical protein
MSEREAPIACTLDSTSFDQRLNDIRALMARSLRGSRRDGRHLHLSFAPDARAAVEDLVRKEKSCCAFLGFELRATATAVDLTVSVPAHAVGDAEILLAPFTLPVSRTMREPPSDP